MAARPKKKKTTAARRCQCTIAATTTMALATRSWHNKEPIVVVVLFVAGVAHAKCGQRHDAKEPAVRTQSSSCLKTLKKKKQLKKIYILYDCLRCDVVFILQS